MRVKMLSTLSALATVSAEAKFRDRAKDWRNGAIVYQVFVDRFAPPISLEAKAKWIKAPRVLKRWSDLPVPGHIVPSTGVWSHELEFWGGDLKGIQGKLDYVQSLKADVLYLTPVAEAFTNHRYDTVDYAKIAPEIGTRHDVANLAHDAHARGMKMMLDGVFNHMGRSSPIFQEALHNPASKYRSWFTFDKRYPSGYKGWSGVANLPGLRLENPAVRRYLWNGQDSIVRDYLRDGIDGWRLDVGFELGPTYLGEITRAAHETKPGSSVVGEISGYPSNWFPAVDGVFNFFSIDVGIRAMRGEMSGGRAGRILETVVSDAGIENLLKSWLLVDNHDTPRLASRLPELNQRKLALALQFTLPGSPVIYYGTELGMDGAGDPQNRAPMNWGLVSQSNQTLSWVKRLTSLHQKLPALRYGDFAGLETEKLIAYARTTDRLKDSVIVVVNPTSSHVKEVFPTRIGRLMSWGELKDAISGRSFRSIEGNLEVEMEPYDVLILQPVTRPVNGISPYNRVN